MINHVSVATLIHEAAEYLARSFGAVEVPPVEVMVVVPDVTALMVVAPVPSWVTLIIEPTGKATEALVGIRKSLAVETFIRTSLLRLSVKTAV